MGLFPDLSFQSIFQIYLSNHLEASPMIEEKEPRLLPMGDGEKTNVRLTFKNTHHLPYEFGDLRGESPVEQVSYKVKSSSLI